MALVDVREEGVYSDGHILCASNAPTSVMERLRPDSPDSEMLFKAIEATRR